MNEMVQALPPESCRPEPPGQENRKFDKPKAIEIVPTMYVEPSVAG